jgi:uncharacterized protein YjiK
VLHLEKLQQLSILTSSGSRNGDPLLSINTVSGYEILGHQEVLLALGDEDTVVLVRFKGDGSASLLSETASSSGTASSYSMSVVDS